MRLLVPLATLLAVFTFTATARSAVTVGGIAPSTITGACAHCGTFQAADSGPNAYAAPVRGIVTSFTIRSGTIIAASDKYRLWIGEPSLAPNWTLTGASDFVTWPALSAEFKDAAVTWKTRVPIMQGARIGLEVLDSGGNTSISFGTGDAADKAFAPAVSTFNVGDTSTSGTTFNSVRTNVSAVIEPDADHDGYGDETQDGCPGDRADQGPCTAPAISAFKFSLPKFSVDKTAPVLSAAETGLGTTIIITLSKAAHVTFVMNLKGVGRKVGKTCKKKTKKNARKKKCTYYPRSFTFARDVPAGTSNYGFSGRLKVGSKTRTLPVGSYVATAYPFSIASQLGGPIAKTTFKVARAPKRH